MSAVLDAKPRVEVLVTVSALNAVVPVKVGAFEKTAKPVPVSSVSAEMRFADDGVPKKVATLVPSPETPVLIGRPVEVVRVSESLMYESPMVVDAETTPVLFAARTPPEAPKVRLVR